MMKSMQALLYGFLLIAFIVSAIEARPPNGDADNQELDTIEPDVDEVRNAYYDLPSQSLYPSLRMDRLQMLLAQSRPNAYFRSPTWANSMNDLYRVPETKRQVRYRQCYFNPISCFKK